MQILPTGPKHAKIMIVTDYPSQSDIMERRLFSGSSGHLVNSVLSEVGIDRQQCYCTSVMKVRPPGGDLKVLYQDNKCTVPTKMLEDFRLQIQAEAREVKPNVIVVFGNEGLYAFTGRTGVSNCRGTVIPTGFGKVIPTLNPSTVIKMYNQRPIMTMDFHRAKRESLTPEYKKPEVSFNVSPTFEEAMTWMRADIKKLAFDIETVGGFESGLPMFVRCIGLARNEREAIIIPLLKNKNDLSTYHEGGTRISFNSNSPDLGSYWSIEEEEALLKELYRLFADPSIEKIAQNAPFDTQVLEKHVGFKFNAVNWDTMLMHHTMYSELPKGLDFLCSMYTNFPQYWDYDVSVDKEVFTYCAYDCVTTFVAWQELKKELQESNLLDFYEHHIHPTMVALTRMQDRGVLVDLEERERIRVKTELEMNNQQDLVAKLSGGLITKPNSPKQCCDYFYSVLRLPTEVNPRTRRPTSDENAIESLLSKYPEHEELFKAILEFRGLQKLLSTYLDIPLEDGKYMKASFNLAGTVTGRLSSSSTYEGYGSNFQNQPKTSFRRIYRARPGKVLFKCDLSQAEWRYVCWAAPIPLMVENYNKDPDFDAHSWSAVQIYDIPESDVRKPVKEGETRTYRDYAKNGNYGGNYGMKPRRASKTWKVPFNDAKFILEKREKIIPEVPRWWRKIQKQLTETRLSINPLGRKRFFLGRLDDDMFRAAYSHEPQSTVGDLLNRAILILDFILPETCYALIQVHDELVFESDNDPEVVVKNYDLIKNVIEYPIKFDHVDAPLVIPCDREVGDNWYDQVSLEKWLSQRSK